MAVKAIIMRQIQLARWNSAHAMASSDGGELPILGALIFLRWHNFFPRRDLGGIWRDMAVYWEMPEIPGDTGR